jgi:hypothetical protein
MASAAGILVALGIAAAPVAAQQGAYRFEITAVGDSTVTFRTADVPWVKAGMHGIVVDPARRDALIARVAVTRISGSLGTAIVTGQTAPLTAAFVVLLEPPKRHWYQQPAVWISLIVGAAIGVVATR